MFERCVARCTEAGCRRPRVVTAECAVLCSTDCDPKSPLTDGGAGVAWLRAAHQIVDAEPRILGDPIAPRLFDDAGPRAIEERRSMLTAPGARGLRAHVLLRSRFAEDPLAADVAHDVGQHVILGAGLDTFAYRQPG